MPQTLQIIEQEIQDFIERNEELFTNSYPGDWKRQARSTYFNNWPWKLPGSRLRSTYPRKLNDDIDGAIIKVGIDFVKVEFYSQRYQNASRIYGEFWRMPEIPSDLQLVADLALHSSLFFRRELTELVFPAYVLLREMGYSYHVLIN